MTTRVRYDDVLAIVDRLVEVHRERHETIAEPIVLVGGTAMAAHGLRDDSAHVDLLCPAFSDDATAQTEAEMKANYGDQFRLDVTAVPNVWGPIFLRDIDQSPVVGSTAAGRALRALRVEDLFLVKLQAGRDKDRDDLPRLAAATTADALIDRFGRLAQWHGNRGEVLRYADDMVRALVSLFRLAPDDVIGRLTVSDSVRDALKEAWLGPEHHES